MIKRSSVLRTPECPSKDPVRYWRGNSVVAGGRFESGTSESTLAALMIQWPQPRTMERREQPKRTPLHATRCQRRDLGQKSRHRHVIRSNLRGGKRHCRTKTETGETLSVSTYLVGVEFVLANDLDGHFLACLPVDGHVYVGEGATTRASMSADCASENGEIYSLSHLLDELEALAEALVVGHLVGGLPLFGNDALGLLLVLFIGHATLGLGC